MESADELPVRASLHSIGARLSARTVTPPLNPPGRRSLSVSSSTANGPVLCSVGCAVLAAHCANLTGVSPPPPRHQAVIDLSTPVPLVVIGAGRAALHVVARLPIALHEVRVLASRRSGCHPTQPRVASHQGH